MRRFMTQIAERHRAATTAAKLPLSPAKTSAQVASQTMDAMAVTGAGVDHMPIFQPLIGMDKEEIVTRRPPVSAALETSILPV